MRPLVSFIALLIFSSAALAGPGAKGRGGIVLHHDAPVFKERADKVPILTMKRGEVVVGNKSPFIGQIWDFVEVDGMVRVAYLVEGKSRKKVRKGWMRPADLEKFSYEDCGITPEGAEEALGVAWPWSPTGDWTICFQEARDAKLKELKAKWANEAPASPETTPSP